MNPIKLLAITMISIGVTGCANLNSIYRTFDISQGKSPLVDIRQRAILVGSKNDSSESKRAVVCAEPSPDAMTSLAYEVAAKGGTPKVSGELALAMQEAAAFTGLRTQSIQLLRDFGYRLCEANLSGFIDKSQHRVLMRRYQKNTVALLAIEQLTQAVRVPTVVLTSQGSAEIVKSLPEKRAVREKLADGIAELEKKVAEAKKADASADTSALDGQIKRKKEDLDAIDKSIGNDRGLLAGGKTEATIQPQPVVAGFSRADVTKVAEVVREIVQNIVLSDEVGDTCLELIKAPRTGQDNETKAFVAWCVAEFQKTAPDRKFYMGRVKILGISEESQ